MSRTDEPLTTSAPFPSLLLVRRYLYHFCPSVVVSLCTIRAALAWGTLASVNASFRSSSRVLRLNLSMRANPFQGSVYFGTIQYTVCFPSPYLWVGWNQSPMPVGLD